MSYESASDYPQIAIQPTEDAIPIAVKTPQKLPLPI
jgi:hypothetical protein